MLLSLKRTSLADPDAEERDGVAESVVCESTVPLASDDSFEASDWAGCGPSIKLLTLDGSSWDPVADPGSVVLALCVKNPGMFGAVDTLVSVSARGYVIVWTRGVETNDPFGEDGNAKGWRSTEPATAGSCWRMTMMRSEDDAPLWCDANRGLRAHSPETAEPEDALPSPCGAKPSITSI
jgi:hypothetical protein